MVLDRDIVLRDLRKNVIEIHFTKVDGTPRVMRGTLDPVHLPESYLTEKTEESKYHNENPNVIACWDIQKGGWRSFRIDSVEYLQIIDNY